jgi:uncharacterized protein
MKNLIRSIILFILLLSVLTYIIYIDSTNGALTRLSVHKQELIHETIPESMDGLTFVYLSDIHAYTLDETYYKDIMTKVTELKPDFIFIGGDLIDETSLSDEQVLQMIDWLSSLPAPLGKFAVLSDLDIEHIETIEAIYSQSNIEILDNTVLNLHNKSKDSIQLIGLSPDSSNELLNQIEQNQYNIVLSYDPSIYSDWKNQNIELFFGAKTHGGQVNLPLYGSLFDQANGSYIKGTYKSDTSQLIISNGIGVSNLRARWMCDPTIYYFTLRNN